MISKAFVWDSYNVQLHYLNECIWCIHIVILIGDHSIKSSCIFQRSLYLLSISFFRWLYFGELTCIPTVGQMN